MDEIFEARRISIEARLVRTALELSEHLSCAGFSIPVPCTTPALYVTMGMDSASQSTVQCDADTLIFGMCKCKFCKGEGWVCENHADKPWTGEAGGCKCGAGAPCACNTNADLPDGFTVIASVKGN